MISEPDAGRSDGYREDCVDPPFGEETDPAEERADFAADPFLADELFFATERFFALTGCPPDADRLAEAFFLFTVFFIVDTSSLHRPSNVSRQI